MAVGVINNWAQKLGDPAQIIGQRVGELERAPMQALKSLGVAYSKAAVEANKFGKSTLDARVDIPPFGLNPSPTDAMASLRPTTGGTYYQARAEKHDSAGHIFKMLMSRRRQNAARLVRLIQTNAPARAAFESTVGGRVVNNQRGDGVIDVHRNSAGVNTSAMGGYPGGTPSTNPAAGNIYDIFAAMEMAIQEKAAALGTYASSYGAAGKGSMGMAGPFGMSGYIAGMDGDSLGLGGIGGYGAFDGNLGGAPDSGVKNSLDTQTLELKRMIDKRDQMFNLYTQSMNKHNETAKTIIGNLRS